MGRSLTYTLRDGAFEWTRWSRLRGRDLLEDDRAAEERTAMEEAQEFLCELLADGPRPSKDVLQGARASGISENTLRRAKSRLQVKVSKAEFHGGWSWALPSEEASKMATDHEDGQDGHKGLDGHLREDRAGLDASRPS